MNKPAVMKGTYVDIRFMSGHKVARVSIDIPIEHSNEFLAMFGAPDRASPVWCAVARLQPAEPLAEGAQAPATPEKPTRHFRDMPRSQQAALKLDDADFCSWLNDRYVLGRVDAGGFDGLLKRVLGIQSKKELDVPGPAAEAFDRLLTSFEYRDRT